MTDSTASPTRAAQQANANQGRRRAAGIYGAIVTAAILDATGGRLPTDALAITVIVTLLVYWVAEQYAEILGEQAAAGRLPSRSRIRESLVTAWPMVTASYVPLLALLATRVAGASSLQSANAGLIAAIIVLTVHGWSAARSAQLRGRQLIAVTSVALALGLVMILLKDLVLIHLH
jgi:hypothetical protein